MKKKAAFTLSELLLALIIVGVIAVITIPVLVNNFQKKYFATQLRNFVAQLEQLAQNQMIIHHTRYIANTDFSSENLLLTDKHFPIIRSCNKDNTTSKCWKTAATGSEKITYKYIGDSTRNFTSGGLFHRTVFLKNGILFNFALGNSKERAYRGGTIEGYFYVDVNGNDKPNVIGRDMFVLWITDKGKIVGYAYTQNKNYSLKQLKSKCKTDLSYCYEALKENNWKMDY